MSITGTIRDAVKICYSKPADFIGMSALVFLPSFSLSLLNMTRDPDNLVRTDPSQAWVGLLSLVLLVAWFVLWFYFLGAVPVLTAYTVDERPMSWAGAFSWVQERRLFWSVFLVTLLMGLAMLAGLVLLIIPGLIAGLWFMLSIPAVVLGGHKAGEALSTSRRLVRPIFWDAAGFSALLWLPFLVPVAAQVATALVWGAFSVEAPRVVIPAVLTYVTSVFWGPVISVALTLMYIDRSGGLHSLRSDLFL